MAIAFVSYDLQRPGQAWSQMDEALKGIGGFRALETVWFFKPGVSVDQVKSAVEGVADVNDKWIVGTATAPAAWSNLGEKWTPWLRNNL